MDHGRLRKLLLIALRTDKDGEAAAACRAIIKVLAKDGHDAEWLVDKLVGRPSKYILPVMAEPWENEDWDAQLTFVSADEQIPHMKFAELSFIHSLLRQRALSTAWKPTIRQRNWLRGIYQRVKNPPPPSN